MREPTLHHYVRWEAPPHANRENLPNDILVAIPKDLAKPAPVGLHLHCWGGSPWSGYGWGDVPPTSATSPSCCRWPTAHN